VRSRYREALRTYWRFPLILQAIAAVITVPVAGMILANEWPRVGNAVPLVFALPWFASYLSKHLKEMLGSPRSRVTPDLHRTHLVIAAAITAVLAVVIPLLVSLVACGFRGPHLTIVAIALAAFVIPAFVAQFLPIFTVVPTAWAVWFLFSGNHELEMSQSAALPRALLGVSAACLVMLAVRLGRFHEEASGYSKRWLLQPLWRNRATINKDRDEVIRYWPQLLIPLPRNLRALGGQSPGVGEKLLRRALHWHAAWRVGWSMVLQGIVFGGMQLVILLSLRPQSTAFFEISLFTIFAGLAPTVWLGSHFAILQAPARARLATEFLRPFSRTEHVRAVGLVLAISVVAEALLIVAIPLAGFWLTGANSLWIRQSLWLPAAAASSVPLFFGVGTANLDSEDSFWAMFASLIAYGIFLWLLASYGNEAVGWLLLDLCAVMVAIGVAVMRASYLSWLNRDVG
jgi:hypothetical protein